MHREIGGDERDGDADEVDADHEDGVRHKVSRMEKSQMELLVKDVDSGKHKHDGQRGANGTVEDAAPEERAGDESHLGAHHTHRADGGAVGID